jgi:hypothetical protein
MNGRPTHDSPRPTRRSWSGWNSTKRTLTLLTLGLILVPAAGVDAERTPTRTPASKKRLGVRVEAERSITATSSPVSLGTLDPQVLQLALESTRCAIAQGAVAASAATLTLIDYSRPSTVPRLWVVDLESGALLFEELVAHGSGSGDDLATRFSNTLDSRQSSLGLFTTEDTYVGKHGYSLRLQGLESGVNDRARERAIVMHGADYVSAQSIAALGRLGRSWGCPALRPAIVRDVIDRIKGGNVVFAYYPDPTWLAGSAFLNGCGSAART